MKKFLFASAMLGLMFAVGSAQQPTSTPPEDIVRISTELIQIDVTVTDKSGKVVPGLDINDFEVYENGEKQTLTGALFATRSIGGATVSNPAASAGQSNNIPATADAVILAPRDVRRTIAIVVDDFTMSFGSVYYARVALRRFVEQQMQPGDLVAIIRTSGSVGALQQFTSDKRVLLAAINAIRWNPMTADVEALNPTGQTPQEVSERFTSESNHVAAVAGQDSSGRLSNMKPHESITQTKARDFSDLKNANPLQEGVYAQASLGTMRYIVSGMNELPGRKVMMFFSDGFEIGRDSTKSRSSEVGQNLQDLADFANRSSIVVYTFDTRGLKSMSIQASDSTYEVIDGHRAQKEALRTEKFKDKQDGLVYLAKQTGGQALLDSNDLNGGIQRSLDEQSGYYLLAYVPAAENFDPDKRKFNKLEVRVTRPGLNVAYRSGFFSNAQGQDVAAFTGPQKDLAKALTSPFATNEIAVSTNALFADDATDGGYVRSFLHIDAKSLTFTDAPEGWKTATFDVAAVAFGSNGVPVERKESQYTIKAKGPTLDAMMQKGFVYVLIMPMKTPGVYQYRVAVRDKTSGKIGSAAQILDVPDLNKRKLALSNLAVENVSMAIWQNIASGKVGSGPGQVQVPSTLLYDTVLRQFKPGSVLRYGFEVYNAKADGSMPKLETQAKIFQNRSTIVEGNLNKVDVSAQKDPQHVKVSGAIMLKDTLTPGDYVLQLTVFDRSGKQSAIQILPFEIVK